MTEIFRFETIASTQAFAFAELAKNPRNFVVRADMQTRGIGREDRAWLSPHGNLSASFALCPDEGLRPEQLAKTAIQIAEWICQWALKNLQFELRLKWPNDLLLHGRKVGGILVDTVTQGAKVTQIVVGVGLNFKEAPMDPAGKYRTASLAPGKSKSEIEDLLDVFCEDFATAFFEKKFFDASLVQTFNLHPGILVEKDGEGFYVEGISKSGELLLVDEKGEKRSVSSTREGWKFPVYENLSRPSLIGFFVDVGNTRTKWRKVFSDGVIETSSFEEAQKNHFPIFSINVNDEKTREIEASMACRFFKLERRFPRQLSSLYDVAQIGIDRICVVKACEELRDVVIVSAGTCTTIDAIKSRQHIGGWIIPGLETMARSLSVAAPALPFVDMKGVELQKMCVGTNTETAISNGIISATAEIIRTLAKDAQIILTGGFAKQLESLLPEKTAIDEELVFKGAYRIVFG